MTMDVYKVMAECRNFFETGWRDTLYTIQGGMLSPSTCLTPGAWIAIQGSMYHDGVYQLGADGVLTGESPGTADEEFPGRVWFLNPPSGFLSLCEDIAKFEEKTPVGAYKSESFGAYAYTRASGKQGELLTWQEYFAKQLSFYRHMYTEVNV